MTTSFVEPLVLVLTTFSFIGLFFVSLFSHSIKRLRSQANTKLMKAQKPPFYFRMQRAVLKDANIESVLFCSSTVQHILQILLFFICFTLYFEGIDIERHLVRTIWSDQITLLGFSAFILGLFFLFVIVLDLFPRLLAYYFPQRSFSIATPLSTPFFIVFSPFSFLLYRLMRAIFPGGFLSPYSELAVSSKEKLLEVIHDIDEGALLNEHDKELLESVLSFRDRIVREVMVPRVDLFCLPHDTTIRDATYLLQKEGYSRVPVYKGTQDHILGVLMYKDILIKYMEFEAMPKDSTILDTPIEEIIKNALYTPETKKISVLLQEFRKKQTHLAVVVDEYGGTAGVVTIEDILEEIVGEIADEYDEEEKQYWPLQRGGWIVDGKMNLLDLEEEIGLKFPQEGDYDTVAGYAYFRLGTIPKKGVMLDQDDFHIEILSNDDRFVEKVKIIPLSKKRLR